MNINKFIAIAILNILFVIQIEAAQKELQSAILSLLQEKTAPAIP